MASVLRSWSLLLLVCCAARGAVGGIVTWGSTAQPASLAQPDRVSRLMARPVGDLPGLSFGRFMAATGTVTVSSFDVTAADGMDTLLLVCPFSQLSSNCKPKTPVREILEGADRGAVDRVPSEEEKKAREEWLGKQCNRLAAAGSDSVAALDNTTECHVLVAKGSADPVARKGSVGECEGVWIVLATPCPGSDADEVKKAKVAARFELKNPWGYLPADLYPELPLYGIFWALHFPVLAWYGFLCFKHRAAPLLMLQKQMGMVLVFSFLQYLSHWVLLAIYNGDGVDFAGKLLFATLLNTLKATLLRVLVLVVSMGYGVVRPTLGQVTLYRIGALAVTYSVCHFILYYIDLVAPVWGAAVGGDVARGIFVFAYAAYEAAWYWWTFTSLVHTISFLQARKQTVKLIMYRRFLWLLVVVLVVFLMVFIIAWIANAVRWVLSIFLSCFNLSVLGVIAYIWRPVENNTRYTFRPAAGDEDPGDDIVLGPVTYNDVRRAFASPADDDDDDDTIVVDSRLGPEPGLRKVQRDTSGGESATSAAAAAAMVAATAERTALATPADEERAAQAAFTIDGFSDDDGSSDVEQKLD